MIEAVVINPFYLNPESLPMRPVKSLRIIKSIAAHDKNNLYVGDIPTVIMRVAMLAYSLRPRGGVVHAFMLSEALARKGVDVEMFSLRRRGSTEDQTSFFGDVSVKTNIFEFNWSEDSSSRLRSMTEALVSGLPRDFDIYHAQDCVCDTALQLLTNEGSIEGPTMRTVHHVQGFQDPFINRCEMNALIGPTEKITVSKYWKDELKSKYGLDSNVVYNGIDAGKYLRSKTERGNFILFVGGMEARKGLEFVIEALEVLHSHGLDMRLVAVARPGFLRTESREWFEHLIERCDQKGKVEIKELIGEKELIDLYSSASAFVLPTRMEGWGLSLMEAMAAGCPVISTPVGGVPELISDGKNGILVPVGDVAGTAHAIERVVNEPALRKQLCEEARKTIKKFTWDAAADETKKIYERVLSKKSGQ
jgi:glycosyltransferase involved in cell wall biosynthesis